MGAALDVCLCSEATIYDSGKNERSLEKFKLRKVEHVDDSSLPQLVRVSCTQCIARFSCTI
jgi:hypothetical protein